MIKRTPDKHSRSTTKVSVNHMINPKTATELVNMLEHPRMLLDRNNTVNVVYNDDDYVEHVEYLSQALTYFYERGNDLFLCHSICFAIPVVGIHAINQFQTRQTAEFFL